MCRPLSRDFFVAIVIFVTMVTGGERQRDCHSVTGRAAAPVGVRSPRLKRSASLDARERRY
jgi:hypothetical protein